MRARLKLTLTWRHDLSLICCHVQSNDFQMLADMGTYLANAGAVADGRHNQIPHAFWWAWNANSGDTGGVVQDDWITVRGLIRLPIPLPSRICNHAAVAGLYVPQETPGH